MRDSRFLRTTSHSQHQQLPRKRGPPEDSSEYTSAWVTKAASSRQGPTDGERVLQTGGLQMGPCPPGDRALQMGEPVFLQTGGLSSSGWGASSHLIGPGRTQKVVFTWSTSKHPLGPAWQGSPGCAALSPPGRATAPTRWCQKPQDPDVFGAAPKAAVCSPANPSRTNRLSLEAGTSGGP